MFNYSDSEDEYRPYDPVEVRNNLLLVDDDMEVQNAILDLLKYFKSYVKKSGHPKAAHYVYKLAEKEIRKINI